MLLGRPYPAVSYPAGKLWDLETEPRLYHCNLSELVDPSYSAVLRAILEAASIYAGGEAALGAVLDRLQHDRFLSPDRRCWGTRCEFLLLH